MYQPPPRAEWRDFIIYDHEVVPLKRGRFITGRCSVCQHWATAHYAYGVSIAERVGGRPYDYITPLEPMS